MTNNKTSIARKLRKQMTDSEIKLWNRLKQNQLGVKFGRQQPMGNYITDFACLENRLIIEVDDGQHDKSDADIKRDSWFKKEGYKVLRFWNNEVLSDIDGVLEVILQSLSPSPDPSPQGRGKCLLSPDPSPQGRGAGPLFHQGEENYNTIIIGAGPAGIAAAIQLKRAGINFLLLEKNIIGGLLNNANLVENYPGISKSLSGPDLAALFKEHLTSNEIAAKKEEVVEADYIEKQFVVKTADKIYSSDNLIVACGTRPKKLSPSMYEPEVAEKIFYEVYPLQNISNKHIAIIGGGDAAFDYALNLSGKNKVSILHRSPKTKCLTLLFERAKRIKSINLYPEIEVTNIYSIPLEGEDQVGVTTRSPFPQGRGEFSADLILAAIGREPEAGFLSAKIYNHLLEKKKIPGLYYAGDVARGINRQTAIAVGDGVGAAMEIINNISPRLSPLPQGERRFI